MSDSTSRFSDRAAAYARGRPGYPVDALAWAEQWFPARPCHIADLGAGTGISSEAWLARGHRVTAVEPNADMLERARTRLGEQAGFEAVQGSAEQTRLAPGTVDVISVAQALHWFDAQACRRERARIGVDYVVVLQNQRSVDCDAFHRDYEAFLDEWGGELYRPVRASWDLQGKVATLAGSDSVIEHCSFPLAHLVDAQTLRARALSSSYLPKLDAPRGPQMVAALAQLFERHASEGQVAMRYATEVWVVHPQGAKA